MVSRFSTFSISVSSSSLKLAFSTNSVISFVVAVFVGAMSLVSVLIVVGGKRDGS